MKVKQISAVGLHPIICAGEVLENWQAGKATSAVLSQLHYLKDAVNDWRSVVLCYEPVWRLGLECVLLLARLKTCTCL